MKPTGQQGVASPCINECQLHTHTGLCHGCWRSLDEIMTWSTASETQKRQIWKNILLRKSGAVPDADKISTPN